MTRRNICRERKNRSESFRHEHAYGDTEAAALGLGTQNTVPVVPEPPKMSGSMTDSCVAK